MQYKQSAVEQSDIMDAEGYWWFIERATNYELFIDGHDLKVPDAGWYLLHRAKLDLRNNDGLQESGNTTWGKMPPYMEKLLEKAYEIGRADQRRIFRKSIEP